MGKFLMLSCALGVLLIGVVFYAVCADGFRGSLAALASVVIALDAVYSTPNNVK